MCFRVVCYQQDVIEAQYEVLVGTLTTCNDYEQFGKAHEEYLTSLVSQCLLGNPLLLRSLERIFGVQAAVCRMMATPHLPPDDKRLAELSQVSPLCPPPHTFIIGLITFDDLFGTL